MFRELIRTAYTHVHTHAVHILYLRNRMLGRTMRAFWSWRLHRKSYTSHWAMMQLHPLLSKIGIHALKPLSMITGTGWDLQNFRKSNYIRISNCNHHLLSVTHLIQRKFSINSSSPIGILFVGNKASDL